MRKTIPVLLIACVFISIVSFSSAEERKYIESKAGRRFEVSLESNKSTGFEWQFEMDPPSGIARMVKYEYRLKYPRMIGQGGEEIWSFRALAAGTVRITFKYRRPWEKKAAAEREVVYYVTVKP